MGGRTDTDDEDEDEDGGYDGYDGYDGCDGGGCISVRSTGCTAGQYELDLPLRYSHPTVY